MLKNEEETSPLQLIITAILFAAIFAADRLTSSAGYEPAWYIRLALYLVPYLLIGFDVLKEAFEGILHGELLDEDFLMAVATLGALALGEYPEAVFVMLFSQIGEFFEDFAGDRSRKSISDLMNLRPDTALLIKDRTTTEVPAAQLIPGDVILIRPGEKIPVDGELIEGFTSLDTSALTGETVPRTAEPGNQVLSGCLNVSAAIKMRVTKTFDNSTVARILELVEDAGEKKAKAENFITRFAHVYTPVVVGAAVILAVIPPLILHGNWNTWLYRALTFLIISCPCALVISIPLSFFGGIGAASKQGILIKGSSYIDALTRLDTIVFDKTGTLTRGIFAVQAVHADNSEAETGTSFLEYAALAESGSTHPAAQAVCAAYTSAADEMPRILDTSRVSSVEETAGQGVKAIVDGKSVWCGNEKLMETAGAVIVPCTICHPHEGTEHTNDCVSGTVVHVAINGTYAGHIVIADELKPTSQAALETLKKAGVRKTVLLTGDTTAAARSALKGLSLDEIHADLLPEDKVLHVEQLLSDKRTGSTLAFTGDGINDAPVLARADIGIAMGALGSDATIEAADIVLMDDDPLKIASAYSLAKRTLRIVKENIWFALGVKAAVLALGAFGYADMWLASFADVGVSVLAILNAMRTGYRKF